jgi:hypothetical protein
LTGRTRAGIPPAAMKRIATIALLRVVVVANGAAVGLCCA